MPSLRVIQAPVFHGYSFSAWVEFEDAPDMEALESTLCDRTRSKCAAAISSRRTTSGRPGRAASRWARSRRTAIDPEAVLVLVRRRQSAAGGGERRGGGAGVGDESNRLRSRLWRLSLARLLTAHGVRLSRRRATATCCPRRSRRSPSRPSATSPRATSWPDCCPRTSAANASRAPGTRSSPTRRRPTRSSPAR